MKFGTGKCFETAWPSRVYCVLSCFFLFLVFSLVVCRFQFSFLAIFSFLLCLLVLQFWAVQSWSRLSNKAICIAGTRPPIIFLFFHVLPEFPLVCNWHGHCESNVSWNELDAAFTELPGLLDWGRLRWESWAGSRSIARTWVSQEAVARWIPCDPTDLWILNDFISDLHRFAAYTNWLARSVVYVTQNSLLYSKDCQPTLVIFFLHMLRVTLRIS